MTCTPASYSSFTLPCSPAGSGGGGAAASGSLDPLSSVTDFAGNISQLYPIVLAVGGAAVALLVLLAGVRMVLRVLHPDSGGEADALGFGGGGMSDDPDELSEALAVRWYQMEDGL